MKMRFLKVYQKELNQQLSPIALTVYTAILAMRKNDGYTVASAAAIARRCNIHRNSVTAAVRELCAADMLCKINRYSRQNGYRIANCYTFNQALRTGKFVKVPYDIFFAGLSVTAFATYLHIKKCANHADRAFPSLSRIASDAGVCVNTVISAVKLLAELNLLVKKTYVRVRGCLGNNNYLLRRAMQKIVQKRRSCRPTRFSFSIRRLCQFVKRYLFYLYRMKNRRFFHTGGTSNFVQLS